MINLYINIRTGSADKDTPYDPRDPRPDWPYQPIDQSTSPPSRPEQYRAAVGDRTKMSCEIENRNARTSWRRQDGGPLPRNAYLAGGDLIIEYVQDDAAGVYECVVHEPNGEYPIITTELVIVGKYLGKFTLSHSSELFTDSNWVQFECRIAENHFAPIDAVDCPNGRAHCHQLQRIRRATNLHQLAQRRQSPIATVRARQQQFA